MTGDPQITVPVDVRVKFAHASVQAVADRCGADVLHIKGPAVDPTTNPGRPPGTDADVMVRPKHVRRLVKALTSAGWTMWCNFDEGSRFEHAASFHHPHFGMLDIHRNFPGLHNAPEKNFATLWDRRGTRAIAGVPCAVLDPLTERLVLVLHAGRTSPGHIDLRNHWTEISPEERDEMDQLARTMGATVGLAVATNRQHLVQHHPELSMWREYGPDERLQEWLARWRAAPTARDRLSLVVRAPRVNRFELGQRLGHPPNRQEIRQEWRNRAGRGVRSLFRMLRRSP